mmetsp:Transcript_29022/g.40788  ORF Transcript_29022/g.40788 Transcript_29022/m.40788 type:complete len:375 (+) Transcript_29022:49-1173(+)
MKFVAALQILSLVVANTNSVAAFMQPAATRMTAMRRSPVMAAVADSAEEAAVEDKKVSIEEDIVVKEEPKAETPAPVVEEPAPVVEAAAVVDPREKLEPGRFDSIDYSITLPFLEKPKNLDGSHAGDFGFDPCGFTEDYDIYYMQECETRHARLAMLAVVGWPLSELVGPNFMLQNGCAPSVLNGMNPIAFLAIAGAFSAFGYLEYMTSLRQTAGTELGDKHMSDMSNIWKYGVAGDYNFDPAKFYSLLGDDASGRKGLRTLEVTQGRYAMLGITYFAAYEALTGSPIVKDSMFFHPNLTLPFLAIAYFAWSQIYEVSDLREYPIKIQYTKDGKEMLRMFDRSTAGIKKDVNEKLQPYADQAGEALAKMMAPKN